MDGKLDKATHSMRASGRPGWMYPKMNSVSTFSPIWLFVTASMIPMGREKP